MVSMAMLADFCLYVCTIKRVCLQISHKAPSKASFEARIAPLLHRNLNFWRNKQKDQIK